MWMQSRKAGVGDPSAWAKNIIWGFIALTCFSVFLTFLYIVFNIANLAVEREGRTVVVCQAQTQSCPGGLTQLGRCSPDTLRWHHGLALQWTQLLLPPSLWPAALPVPGNKVGGWAHQGMPPVYLQVLCTQLSSSTIWGDNMGRMDGNDEICYLNWVTHCKVCLGIYFWEKVRWKEK